MVKKMSGGNNITKSEKYLIQILEENVNLHKYQAKLIVKAFIKTLTYFICNCIEFSINRVFEYKTVDKKASKCYVRYRDTMEIIPEHKIMKIKFSENLKNYLNSRKKFKDVRHRENLPLGIRRTIKLF